MKRSFAFAILGLLVVAIAANAANIQGTTVAYWGFNEQAPGTPAVQGGVVIDGADGHNGTIKVGQDGLDGDNNPIPITPVYADPSPFCNNPQASLHLNPGYFNEGDNPPGPNYLQDRVEVPHSTDFNLMMGDLQDYTIEACIKVPTEPYDPELSPGGLGGAIISKRGNPSQGYPTGAGWTFRISNTDAPRGQVAGTIALYIDDGGWNFLYPDAYGTTNVCDNQWHHVAAVIDTNADPTLTTVTLYVDNQIDAVRYLKDIVYSPTGHPYTNVNIETAHDVWIGDFIGRWNDQFVGDMDSVAFSNAALTPGTGPGHFVLNCVPEPSSLVLLVMGALSLLVIRRK